MPVTFWDHNPANITIGVEQERFLHSPVTDTPMPEVVMRQMFEILSSGNSSNGTYEAAIPRITFHSAIGDVRVDCDGYPHIIEVAYPPTDDLDALEALDHEIWNQIESAARRVGFAASSTSFNSLQDEPALVSSLSKEKRRRYQQFLRASRSTGRYANRHYLAAITATQIHLNVFHQEVFSIFPTLYSYLYMVPLFFTQSSCPAPVSAHCGRLLALRDSYPQDYALSCIPATIPTSSSEYEALRGSSGFVRDYSFIAVSDIGTLEFRLACSQPDHSRVKELASFYVAIVVGAEAGILAPMETAREDFWNACESGSSPSQFKQQKGAIANVLSVLPKHYRRPLENFLARATTE